MGAITSRRRRLFHSLRRFPSPCMSSPNQMSLLRAARGERVGGGGRDVPFEVIFTWARQFGLGVEVGSFETSPSATANRETDCLLLQPNGGRGSCFADFADINGNAGIDGSSPSPPASSVTLFIETKPAHHSVYPSKPAASDACIPGLRAVRTHG